MKTLKIINTVLFFASCLFFSCEEEYLDTLPPETQKGAGTFGCYVDGELFTKAEQNIMASAFLEAYYDCESDMLKIECVAHQKKFNYMRLKVNNPCEQVNDTLLLGDLRLSTPTEGCSMFACENSGHIFLSKFDTVNHIVSGIFDFSGRCAVHYSLNDSVGYVGNSIVQITEGRFDIKLSIK